MKLGTSNSECVTGCVTLSFQAIVLERFLQQLVHIWVPGGTFHKFIGNPRTPATAPTRERSEREKQVSLWPAPSARDFSYFSLFSGARSTFCTDWGAYSCRKCPIGASVNVTRSPDAPARLQTNFYCFSILIFMFLSSALLTFFVCKKNIFSVPFFMKLSSRFCENGGCERAGASQDASH